MRICVIGGTGHIGRFLTPMLVSAGHEVTVLSSGRTPRPEGAAWSGVQTVTQAYGVPGWTAAVQALRPEVVIDILQGDTPGLFEALRGTCEHLVVCGSLWMLGLPRVVPTPPVTQAPCPFEGYARRYRQLLETRERAAAAGMAFSAILPPNICGPGKIPLECRGGRSLEVHRSHRRGETVVLPDPGSVLIGPCDAEDIARAFVRVVQQRAAAAGQLFTVGSAYALTALQLVETYGALYGVRLPVELVSWERFVSEVLPDPGAHWHFQANMCPDISALARLGYRPAYTPEQTLERAVRWMHDTGLR